jgi:adenosine kinase
MKVAVAGSVGRDHLMTFPGRFTDSLVAGSLSKVSLSFLVDKLDIHRGGCAANIAFGMGALGLNPLLVAAVGKDWADYDEWLMRHGVNTKYVKISQELYTATFIVTTDEELNQIASFFPGAMSEAREIDIEKVLAAEGAIDLFLIGPDDPEAMIRHSESAIRLGIPVAADPSQQLARMDGPSVKKLVTGATYLFLNEYELALMLQKTGWSDAELFDQVKIRVVTLGAKGARIEEHGKPTITVGAPKEKAKVDPTGVGDSFRSGFMAGLSWGLNHERCAQLGCLIATFCLETKGTQEYIFDREEFMSRFQLAYGESAAAEVAAHIEPRMGL